MKNSGNVKLQSLVYYHLGLMLSGKADVCHLVLLSPVMSNPSQLKHIKHNFDVQHQKLDIV